MTSTSKLVASCRKWVLGAAAAASIHLGILVNPVPASRPRVSRWGTYYAKTYATWMKNATPFAGSYKGQMLTVPLLVLADTVVQRPKTSVRDYPRGDVDNFVKGALDVVTKAAKVWKDDDQIVGLAVFKRFAEPWEEPGTYLDIIPLEKP